AGLHAGAAGDALGFEERLVHAGRNVACKPALVDRERERALHLFAGADAARADDAFRRIEGEIGVGLVLLLAEMVLAVIAVADFAQAHRARHVLQLAVAVRGTGQAVQRMVADIELHDPAAQLRDAVGLGVHLHAVLGRRRAGGGRPFPPLDLDEAQTAGPERLERIRGAQLGDLNPGKRGGAHDRRARRNADWDTVDIQADGVLALFRGRAAVDHGLIDIRMDCHGFALFTQLPRAKAYDQNLLGNARLRSSPASGSAHPKRTRTHLSRSRKGP